MPILLFLKSKWALVGGAVLLAVLVVALAYCSGRKSGENEADLAREKANVEALATASAAAEAAASERASDAATTTQQSEELENVKRYCTDADNCRVLRGCIVMRQQGRDIARIAACRGLAE